MKFYLNNYSISNGVLKRFLRYQSVLTTSVATSKIKPEAWWPVISIAGVSWVYSNMLKESQFQKSKWKDLFLALRERAVGP